jgi:3-hydroxymyristoyl/3-hydroxydecanoyl-(acyl carrier protein) dehydratase
MTIDEALLEGHAGASFVQNLLVEAMAQTAALFAEQSSPSESGLLAGLSRIRFGRAPRTGDSLMVEARLMQRFGDLMRVGGRVTEAGECLAEGEILISLSGGRQRAADPAPLL